MCLFVSHEINLVNILIIDIIVIIIYLQEFYCIICLFIDIPIYFLINIFIPTMHDCYIYILWAVLTYILIPFFIL